MHRDSQYAQAEKTCDRQLRVLVELYTPKQRDREQRTEPVRHDVDSRGGIVDISQSAGGVAGPSWYCGVPCKSEVYISPASRSDTPVTRLTALDYNET